MRIRTILTLAFLFATLVPSVVYGLWSYHQGVREEFNDVRERHLLIAENLGYALERYHNDLSSAFDSISAAMIAQRDVPKLPELMSSLHVVCILIVDKTDGRILSQVEIEPGGQLDRISPRLFEIAQANAVAGRTTFSPVIEGPDGSNELLAVHDFGDKLAIGRIETSYFVSLGRSVAFGKKGHAAIVDKEGNILAHPLPDWVAQRKNIAQVSAVQRMMAGETGIEQFYSPALKGDMIAGLTSVPGPGWGVMVPQPVSELYDKVYWTNITILAVLAAGLTFTAIIVTVFARSLSRPLEVMVRSLRSNAISGKLRHLSVPYGLVAFRELKDYEDSYNHMVDEVSEAHERLRTLAFTDSLTGLPNRARFRELLQAQMSADMESGRGGTLFYLDIDDFKEINDLYGHEMGDKYLRLCGQKLLAIAKTRTDTDLPSAGVIADPIVARIGGDEFAIAISGATGEGDVAEMFRAMRRGLREVAEQLESHSTCSASLGCAVYFDDAASLDELLKLADLAMYRAKKSGKNRAEIYNPAIGRQSPAELRQAVLAAIENDELVLEYQPKMKTEDWSVHGAEALVRWIHPEKGRLAPGIWLPSIAHTPVMNRLGEWVVKRALADYPKWAGADSDMKLAINFASRHFVSPGFPEWLAEAVRETGFDCAQLVVEVTEDTLLSSVEMAGTSLWKLHEAGFSVSVDDFGKGYSNIARLAKLPVDQIKIDRAIVTGATTNTRLLAIMRCIMAMARELDCETVAEGVETLEQARFMSQNGTDILQGFYFSKSLPPEALAEWMAHREKNKVLEVREDLNLAIRS